MKDEGYDSFYSNKSASPEGVCLFWKVNEFELIQKREYPLNGALLDKEEELFSDLRAAINSCKPIKKNPNRTTSPKTAAKESNDDSNKEEEKPAFGEKGGTKQINPESAEPKAGPKVSGRLIYELPHVLQVVSLKHKSTGQHVLVCNTHLYWHPRGSNVRLIQTNTCLRLIKREKVTSIWLLTNKFQTAFRYY